MEGSGRFDERNTQVPSLTNGRNTMINFPLLIMYQASHGGMTARRTINMMANSERKRMEQGYCLDIIVPKGKEQELLPTLEKELSKRFAIGGRLEKQNIPVYVLQVADSANIKQFTAATNGEGYLMAQADSFVGKQVKINQLTAYLENFGIVDLPVVNETGLPNTYDLSIKFEPQKKESLLKALQLVGLQLTKAHRVIEVLVLR